MKNIKDPLIQDVPQLVFNKLGTRPDFAFFIDKAASCRSPSEASKTCLAKPDSFFIANTPAMRSIQGGGGFNRVAQECKKLFVDQGLDAIVALKKEIEKIRLRKS